MPFSNLHRSAQECAYKVQTTIREDQTIDQALSYLRKKHIEDKILYFYALDEEEKLVGVVSARDLLLNESATLISDIMDTNVISLPSTHTLQEAMAILEMQRLLAIPVLDKDGKFLGVIDVSHYLEKSIDVANTKQRFQIFQMLGFVIDEGKKTSTLKSYSRRMPWIFCNMFGGIACAIISRIYEDVLSHVLILAMFIPLVLSLSESISMQSMTQNLNRPNPKSLIKGSLLRSVFIQWKLFALLGITCGVVVGALSLLWGDGVGPAITIMISIMISVLLTALIGAAVPIFLHARRLDPKVASGPIVLMCADVFTTIVYLSIASMLLLP